MPELQETLCADQDGECICDEGDNILYGAATSEGKIDYMIGFAEDVASEDNMTGTNGAVPCTTATFGNPILGDQEMYCWCQTWTGETGTRNHDNTSRTATAQVYSSDAMQGLSALAQVSSTRNTQK